MSQDQSEETISTELRNDSNELSSETRYLHASQSLLGMQAKPASEIADVALIFYVAVGTVIGSLASACVYPLLLPFDPAKRNAWIFFLLCSVAVGSTIGMAIASLLLNARGLISWEKKYRD